MNAKRLLQSHWIGFLWLLPFLVVLGIHDALGLSDAALLLRDQRDRDSQLFNFAMIGIFFAGVSSFVAHAAILKNRSAHWFVVKIVILVAYWSLILWQAPQRGSG